jgi:hypothetical protein
VENLYHWGENQNPGRANRCGEPETGEPLKPAAEPTDSGIVETRTTRRIIPVSEAQDSKTPELWEYLRALPQQDWPRHMVYGYRIEPGPKVQIFRCSEPQLTMPSGRRVPIADEQELEYAITQEFGGGVFRFLVKKGPQIITAGNMEIGAPARAIRIPVDTQAPNNGTGPQIVPPYSEASATAQVAGRAMDALTMQERQSAEIGFTAMRTAAEVMQRFASPGQPNSQDDMLRQVLTELRESRRGMSLQEIIASASSVIALLKELGILGGNANPMVGQVMEIAMKRLLEPPVASGSPVNTGTALVQMLPALGNQFVEGIREFAKVRESEARIIALQRGTAMPPAQNPQVLPPVAPNGAPPNGAQPPANGGAPSVEFVDRKIVEFLKAPNLSADQAADEAMGFLETLDANAVAQLASLGETGLLQLFTSRPILREATSNMPRLVEFIRAFLRMHAEDVAAEHVQAAAQPAKPPLPN